MCRNKMIRREEKLLRHQEKLRHKAEKKAERRRHKETKQLHKAEIRRQLLSQTATPTVQLSLERVEQYVTALRSMFPDCDPTFIRTCLANETEDHVQRIADKLLHTPYPKVRPESPLTPPTAPPLPDSNGEEFPIHDDAPPSYEESLEQQSSPPLPKRQQRASPWIAQLQESQRTRESQKPLDSLESQITQSCDEALKSFFTMFKPSTVEQACHKSCYTWTRPVPSNLRPLSLSQSYKVLPKDKYSIQRGFSTKGYPTKELGSHDVSTTDWYLFISGLNSILGTNSMNGDSSFSSHLGVSVGLKWVKWVKWNETMDDKQMETNILVLNEYLAKWNDSFFAPRRISVQFMEDKTPTIINNKQQPFVQYLLVNSI